MNSTASSEVLDARPESILLDTIRQAEDAQKKKKVSRWSRPYIYTENY